MHRRIYFLLIFLFLLSGCAGNSASVKKDAQDNKGFKEFWVNPAIDFKSYEVMFIAEVDISEIKNKKLTDEDITNLSKEMRERFSKILNNVVPVVANKEEAINKKAMCLNLKLNNITSTNVGFNSAMQVVGFISHIPIPTPSSQGKLSFEAKITDLSSSEELIKVYDESSSDKHTSMLGTDDLDKWKHAYNTFDYWADCLAKILAEKRGQEYKTQLKFKLL